MIVSVFGKLKKLTTAESIVTKLKYTLFQTKCLINIHVICSVFVLKKYVCDKVIKLEITNHI